MQKRMSTAVARVQNALMASNAVQTLAVQAAYAVAGIAPSWQPHAAMA
jgi:hypothetical protein